MDPQIVWNELLEAVRRKDWDFAAEQAETLLGWMRKGGFPPETAPISMPRRWNRAMAEFGCLLSLHFAETSKKRRGRKRRKEEHD